MVDRVVLVRHGETAWSLSGQHTGRTDIPLTDRGRSEAKAVAGTLADWSFAAVYTSPLRRASETAELAGFPEARRWDDLKEWNYGSYEGQTTADIRAEIPGWSVWTHPPSDGEGADDVAARADRVTADLRSRDEPAGDVLLIAHGHFLRILAARWIGLAPTVARNLKLATASRSILRTDGGLAAIERWNERCA